MNFSKNMLLHYTQKSHKTMKHYMIRKLYICLHWPQHCAELSLYIAFNFKTWCVFLWPHSTLVHMPTHAYDFKTNQYWHSITITQHTQQLYRHSIPNLLIIFSNIYTSLSKLAPLYSSVFFNFLIYFKF